MPDTNKTIQPLLELGQIIPVFTLPAPDGMPYSPWTYKQREHLLLLFMSSSTSNETRGLLRAFAQVYTAFREETCAILVITADTVITNLHTQEDLHLSFPLLSNPKGDTIARYTHWDSAARSCTPAIMLADRYNALYQQWLAEQESDLPPIDEILDWLRYINRLCTP